MSDKLTFARELVQHSLQLIERVIFNKLLTNGPRKRVLNKTISQLIDHMIILRWNISSRTRLIKHRQETALRICQTTIAELYEL